MAVRVKYQVLTDEKITDVITFSFFVDMPERPVKGDTFMFNETIKGLDELGDEVINYLHDFEFGIQSTSWQFDDRGPYLEVTVEQVL